MELIKYAKSNSHPRAFIYPHAWIHSIHFPFFGEDVLLFGNINVRTVYEQPHQNAN